MRRRQNQSGAVLVVSLMILVALTLLAVTSVSTSTVNLRIVDNMRAKMQAEDATQKAIEQVMSDIGNFNDPSSAPDSVGVDDPYTSTSPDYTVSLADPECIDATPASGYSAKWGMAPEDTTWVIDAELPASSGPEGAEARIIQGVRIRMVSGSCPGAP